MASPVKELALSTSVTVTSEARLGADDVVSSLLVRVDAADSVGASLLPLMVIVNVVLLVSPSVSVMV